MIREMLNRPEVKASGVAVRFLFPVIRFRPNSERGVDTAYRFVDANRDLWKGTKLVGREDNGKGYAFRFLEVFRKMRRTYPGIRLSIMAGRKIRPDRKCAIRYCWYTPDLSTHPSPEYLRTGVPVCLNTDDPGPWLLV